MVLTTIWISILSVELGFQKNYHQHLITGPPPLPEEDLDQKVSAFKEIIGGELKKVERSLSRLSRQLSQEIRQNPSSTAKLVASYREKVKGQIENFFQNLSPEAQEQLKELAPSHENEVMKSIQNELFKKYSAPNTAVNTLLSNSNSSPLTQLCNQFLATSDVNLQEQIFDEIQMALGGGLPSSQSSGSSISGSDQAESLLSPSTQSWGGQDEYSLGQVSQNLNGPSLPWSKAGSDFMKAIVMAINQLGSGKTVDDLESWLTGLGDPRAMFPGLVQQDLTNIIQSLGTNTSGLNYSFPSPGTKPSYNVEPAPPSQNGMVAVRVFPPDGTKPQDVHIHIISQSNCYGASGTTTSCGQDITMDSLPHDATGYYLYVPNPLTSGNIFFSSQQITGSKVPEPGVLEKQGTIYAMFEITNDSNNVCNVDYSGVDGIDTTASITSYANYPVPGSSSIPLPPQTTGSTENRIDFLNQMANLLNKYGPASSWPWSTEMIQAMISGSGDSEHMISPKHLTGDPAFQTFFQKYLDTELLNPADTNDTIVNQGFNFEATSPISGAMIHYQLTAIKQISGHAYMSFTGKDGGNSYEIDIPCATDQGENWFSGGTSGVWDPTITSGEPHIRVFQNSNPINANIKAVPDLIRDVTAMVNLGIPAQAIAKNIPGKVIGPGAVGSYIAVHGSAALLYQANVPYNIYERAAKEAGFGAYGFDYDDWTGQSGEQANPISNLSHLSIHLGSWGQSSGLGPYKTDITNWMQDQNPGVQGLGNAILQYINSNPSLTPQQLINYLNTTLASISNSKDIYLQYPGLTEATLGELCTSINQTYGSAGVNCPSATSMDKLFFETWAWQPEASGAPLKQDLLNEILSLGSPGTQAALTSWAQGIRSSGADYKNASSVDQNTFCQITNLPPLPPPSGTVPAAIISEINTYYGNFTNLYRVLQAMNIPGFTNIFGPIPQLNLPSQTPAEWNLLIRNMRIRCSQNPNPAWVSALQFAQAYSSPTQYNAGGALFSAVVAAANQPGETSQALLTTLGQLQKQYPNLSVQDAAEVNRLIGELSQ